MLRDLQRKHPRLLVELRLVGYPVWNPSHHNTDTFLGHYQSYYCDLLLVCIVFLSLFCTARISVVTFLLQCLSYSFMDWRFSLCSVQFILHFLFTPYAKKLFHLIIAPGRTTHSHDRVSHSLQLVAQQIPAHQVGAYALGAMRTYVHVVSVHSRLR